MSSWMKAPYSVVFPSALTLAHLALAAALSLALTAGLLRRSFFLAALTFAQRIFRALARAFTSLRRWAADNLRLAGVGASRLNGVGTSPPAMDSIWPCSASICSLMAMMPLSWLVVRLERFVMGDGLTREGFEVNHGDGHSPGTAGRGQRSKRCGIRATTSRAFDIHSGNRAARIWSATIPETRVSGPKLVAGVGFEPTTFRL